MITATFDGNEITSIPGLAITDFDPFKAAPRDLKSYSLAYTNKQATTSGFYQGKKSHMICTLEASSKANMELRLRALEAILQGIEKSLVTPVAGVSTTFTATKKNIIVTKYAGGFAVLDIEFEHQEAFGYETSSTTLYDYSALVGGYYEFAVTWAGNVPQAPVVTITINSLTMASASGKIRIGNGRTGQVVVVSRTWGVSDVLVVNSKTKTVTVNGVEVEFTGAIPEFTSTDPITYQDDFTARNIQANMVYQKRNL